MNLKSTIRWICVIAFLDLLAVSLAVPLLSAHIRSLGGSHFVSGLLSSLYSGLQLISGPVIGSWSDTRGRRSILLLTLPICAICYVLLGIASTIALVIIVRIGLGLMKHIQTLTCAIVSDLVVGPEQAAYSGMVNAVSGAGFIIGPIIGGHMIELENGFLLICLLVATVFSVNIAIVYLFIPDHQATRRNGNAVNSSSYSIMKEVLHAIQDLKSINWPIYWDIFLLKFLLGFAISIFFSEYSISIQEKFQLTPKLVGYTISFQGLVGSIAGISIGHLERLYKHNKDRDLQTFHGFLIFSIALACLGLSPTLSIFVICLIPLCTCSSVLRIISTENLLSRTSNNQAGMLIGTSSSITSIARLIAPMSAGLVRDMFGANGLSMLTVASAFLGTGIAGYVLKTRKSVPNNEMPSTSVNKVLKTD